MTEPTAEELAAERDACSNYKRTGLPKFATRAEYVKAYYALRYKNDSEWAESERARKREYHRRISRQAL